VAYDHAELSDPGGSCRSHQQGSCDDGYRQGYRREDPDLGAAVGHALPVTLIQA